MRAVIYPPPSREVNAFEVWLWMMHTWPKTLLALLLKNIRPHVDCQPNNTPLIRHSLLFIVDFRTQL
jgi:hypothetical protein